MEEKIRWGILATGRIAGQFAQALESQQQGNVRYAVASRTAHKAEDFAQKFGFEKWYGNYQELIEDEAVDIIYIATPHHDHVRWSQKCIQKGKAVLCEKPLGLNRAEVDQTLQMARFKKVFYMEALWTRFIPHFLKVEEWIAGGKIGKLKNIQADFGFKAAFDPAKRLFNKELGGGSLLDIGIYPIFLAYWFLGKPERILGSAVFGKTGVDEQLQLIFDYPDGSQAGLSSSLVGQGPVVAYLNGEEGRISISHKWHGPASASLYRNNEEIEKFELTPICNGYEYEIMEVNQCLMQGKYESDKFSLQHSSDLFELLQRSMDILGINY